MIRKKLLSIFLVVSTIAVGVAAQTPPNEQERALLEQMREAYKKQGGVLTPEMEAAALQKYREMQANILGMQMAAQSMQRPKTKPAAPVAVTPLESTAVAITTAPSQDATGWLAAIARHKESARPTSFEDSKDGFVVGNQPWLDPEGEIQWYGADRATGNVTYLVRQSPTDFVVRFANVNSAEAPVTVGQIRASNNRESFTGIDGNQLSGHKIIPLADGMIATRGSAFFRYEFGSAPTSHVIPSEYTIVYAQRGDVVRTGYILAVKQARKTFGDSFLSANGTPPPKAPAIFGKRDPDFALVDTRSGRLVVIPRSEATTEVLWKHRYKANTGARNPLHFFNAIDWQQTSIGPVAIVFGDSGTNIVALQLNTGQQLTLFKRAMGINDWRATPTEGGGLHVEAQMGLSKESVEDVRTRFAAGE